MKLTFVSNYINHHQIPVAEKLYESLGDNYRFIQVEPMAEERKAMGWDADVLSLPYLKLYYENPDECKGLIMDSDIVVFGGVEDETYILPRLKAGKPVIRVSERLYREGQWKAISPRGLIKKYNDHTKYRDKNVYLLCAGAYVASDFDIVRAYPGKKFKWGYFTQVKQYDLDELFKNKLSHKKERVEILFAGRFLSLKHPEYALSMASYLKSRGYKFRLTMVGGGEMEASLKKWVQEKNLQDVVGFKGYKTPEEVRAYMEKADIFLMTSNYLEGWGAVINEAMNSGCAVIADSKIGAVPFLLKHEETGMIYKDGNITEFMVYAERLVRDEALRRKLGENAYKKIVDMWNPEVAVERLLKLCHQILEKNIEFCKEGPLSKAENISPAKGYRYCRK